MIEFVIFFFFAAVAVIFALVVILHRNTVVGALSLVASFFALAVMYVLLDAPFLAALQIIVYAGAIMVLFLFVIMLLNLSHMTDRKKKTAAPQFVQVVVPDSGRPGAAHLRWTLAGRGSPSLSRRVPGWYSRWAIPRACSRGMT